MVKAVACHWTSSVLKYNGGKNFLPKLECLNLFTFTFQPLFFLESYQEKQSKVLVVWVNHASCARSVEYFCRNCSGVLWVRCKEICSNKSVRVSHTHTAHREECEGLRSLHSCFKERLVVAMTGLCSEWLPGAETHLTFNPE